MSHLGPSVTFQVSITLRWCRRSLFVWQQGKLFLLTRRVSLITESEANHLKEKQRALRDGFQDSLGLRVHRARWTLRPRLSWNPSLNARCFSLRWFASDSVIKLTLLVNRKSLPCCHTNRERLHHRKVIDTWNVTLGPKCDIPSVYHFTMMQTLSVCMTTR